MKRKYWQMVLGRFAGFGIALALIANASPAAAAESLAIPGPVRFVPLGETAIAEAGGGRYRGNLEVAPAPKGGLSLTNELDFEDYLKGIAEVPGRWPAEALRAQAIAARTYVLWELARGPSAEGRQLGYDICATVACQVYRGLDNEAGASGAAWANAVESTRAVAVTHSGKPILARYHSTSGGRTRNNEDVFTSEGPRPYLEAVESPFEGASPLARWSSSFPRAHLEQILSGDKEVPLKGSLLDIRFVKHPDGSGTPNEVTIVGTDGETTVRAATFSRVVSREAKKRWPAEYPPANPALPGSRLPDAVPSSNLAFRIDGDRIVIDGTGWGHGVGMSQYGALGMAEDGRSAEEILRHYYRDTRIESVDEPETVRVGIGSGAPKIVIEADGEYRIESIDGKVIVERALGKFTVEPKSRSSVLLRFPAGSDTPLALSAVSVSHAIVPPGAPELAITYKVARPAQTRFEVRDLAQSRTVYSSAERVVDAGVATDTWSVIDRDGRRPPGGEYEIVVLARAPGEAVESSTGLAIETHADERSETGGSRILLPVAATVALIGALAGAVTLIRRRRRE